MHLVGDNHTLLIIEKEAMAPCTYVRHALSMAPHGHIRFESLKFADIDGPAPINGIPPAKPCASGTWTSWPTAKVSYGLVKRMWLCHTSRCLITDRPELVPRSSTLMR